MKIVSKLSLLLIAISLASCNEKVTPELQEGNSTTPTTSGSGSGSGLPTVVPDEYYFKVTNTSAPLLNYKLHKSGINNSASNCEVKSKAQLSSDAFRGAPSINDITCYFEAEELSLFHSGFNIEIAASPNTCEFVGYSPFGYYSKMPGDSSGSFTEVNCTNDTTNSSHVDLAATQAGLNIDVAGGGKLGCGSWVTNDIDPTVREQILPADDQELCRFNYGAQRCDVGTIDIYKFNVTYTPPGQDPLKQPSVLKYESKKRTIMCGGDAANCISGPTKDIAPGLTRVIMLSEAVVDKPFKTEYKHPSLIGKSTTNRYLANFRRNLANTQIDYGTSKGLPASYKSMFSDPIYGKIFEPRVVDHYAANLLLDQETPLVDNDMIEDWSYNTNKYRAVPHAAEPFVGLVAPVNPFYTFTCYDTGYDIKARIRMVVRDWDRVFPTNSDMELLSDIFKGANARQDIQNYVELPGDLDPTIPFNDKKDWDDMIAMERKPGPFDPFSTFWKPSPTAYYTDGWFNPALFPGD